MFNYLRKGARSMLFEIRYKSLCFAKKVLDKENILDHHLYSVYWNRFMRLQQEGIPLCDLHFRNSHRWHQ